jgi:hypothetical protein
MMLKAEATVRRPGARMAPAISTSTVCQVAAVKEIAKGENQRARTAGAMGLAMAGLWMA